MKPDVEPDLFDDISETDHHDTLVLERKLRGSGYGVIAGVDEAGRGCLAGPVVAAAVILEEGMVIEGVRDSKQISAKERDRLAGEIRHCCLYWAVAQCTPSEIDRLNILWASMEAMRRAIQALGTEPGFVLIDGNTRIPHAPWPCFPVVRGDSRSHSIAAASILAKTHRDGLLHTLHNEHPEYGWNTNVGYPTVHHYDALRRHGPTPYHRRSFRLI